MKKAQYLYSNLKYRVNDPCLKIPFFAIPRRSGYGGLRAFPIHAVQHIVVYSLRFVWNACGLRAAQSSITDTACETVV